MTTLDAVVRRWPYFAIAGTVLAVDQVTKVLAHAHLRGTGAVTVIPGLFDLSYSRNRGGLFGFFGTLGDPWRTVLLTLLPLLAIGLIGLFIVRAHGEHRTTRLGLSLILGGAVGNLIDRIVRGEVVDFLDVYASSERLSAWLIRTFGTAHWPTFNVADSAIVIGAGLLLLDMIRTPATSDEGAARASVATGDGADPR